ncbi:MAG: hypothetical protein ACKOXM_04115 [Agromyces sp.]
MIHSLHPELIQPSTLELPAPQTPAPPLVITPGGVHVDIPKTSASPIRIEDSIGGEIGIRLAPGVESVDASPQADGTVLFPLRNGVVSIAIPNVAGLQLLTAIGSKDAPATFEIPLELQPEQHIELTETGGALVVRSDEAAEYVLPPPWAKDALDREIPTRYVIADGRLSQHVEHTTAKDVAYPVIAESAWIVSAPLICAVPAIFPTIRAANESNLRALLANCEGYGGF